MPRPRTREFVEECGELPLGWFTPVIDNSVVHTKREVWVGAREFQVDVYWSTGLVTDRSATLNLWYDVYTPMFSAHREQIPRDWHADPASVEGASHHRYRLKLGLRSRTTSLRTIVWALICPRCNKSRRKLYITVKGMGIACRDCHNLRYRSQEPREPVHTLPLTQRGQNAVIEAQQHLIQRLMLGRGSDQPAILTLKEMSRLNPISAKPRR